MHEKSHPQYAAYVDNAHKSNHKVDENDLKLFEANTSLAEKGMAMRASLVDKDEVTRRKAQGFQAWLKGHRKLERS